MNSRLKKPPRHNVLVLTRENDIAELLSFLLSAGGFSVTLSQTTDEAVRALLVGKAEALVFDLMFQGGCNLLNIESIRHGWPDIPLITVVETQFRELGEQSVKSGATGYLVKPLDFGLLKGLLQEAFLEQPERRSSYGHPC